MRFAHLTAWLISLALASATSAESVLQRVYTDKARYYPGDVVQLLVDLANSSGSTWQGTLALTVRHWETPVFVEALAVSIDSGEQDTYLFQWACPNVDFTAYAVEATCEGDTVVTAVDVSTEWTRFPRYGFMTEFYSGQSQAISEQMVGKLVEDYHITALQFYDWMWRHEKLIERPQPGVIRDPWEDWRGEWISVAVLHDLIGAAHARNVAAMPYIGAYIAREDYELISAVSPEWGIYADASHIEQHRHDLDDFPWIGMYLFDPANADWQEHMMDEITDALDTLAFDGVHFDHVGYKDPVYDYLGNPLDFWAGSPFKNMINRTRIHLDWLETQLSPFVGQYSLTFNNVGGEIGGWGITDVLEQGDHDFLYAEVWGNESYAGVFEFTQWARKLSGGKALVLAAYVNYHDVMDYFNEPSVRLANAVLAVAGAHHIEMGDGQWMLSSEFFPARNKQMTAALQTAMKAYYSFLTAYENFLFDSRLQKGGSTGGEVLLPAISQSSVPQANAVWVHRQCFDGFEIINLVNLLGNDDLWRNPAVEPTALVDIPVICRLSDLDSITDVIFASPDILGGRQIDLDFYIATDDLGAFLSFNLPQLQYWDMVIIRRQERETGLERFEAEDAIRANVAVDSDHVGYSGSGFVDQFETGEQEGVIFSACVPVAGAYDLTFGYANGAGSLSVRDLHVNRELAGQLEFPQLGSWDLWGEVASTVELPAGELEIALGFGGSGPINLDYLDLPINTSGLRGQYFDAVAPGEPAAIRLDSTIDFDWGSGPPVVGVDGDTFIVRWNGRLHAPVSGLYTFYVTPDDGARLFVNDDLIIDAWQGQCCTTTSGQCELAEGVDYPITLVYREDYGNAYVRLEWSAPGIAIEPVPQHYLSLGECRTDGQPPSAVCDLATSDVSSNSVQLQWSDSIDDLAFGGYQVLRDGVAVAEVSSNGWTDASVVSSAVYLYAVRAFDYRGNLSRQCKPLLIEIPGLPPFGDSDLDGDVDGYDFTEFANCQSAPGSAPTQSRHTTAFDCLDVFDHDRDGDVDLLDFAAFQIVFDTSATRSTGEYVGKFEHVAWQRKP